MGNFWVFGYGSLMWRPGFAHVGVERGRLHGFRRALCVTSIRHRGTPDRPGLVLGLDRGGSCVGLCFRVPGALEDEVLAYLRDREIGMEPIYEERTLPVRLSSGEVAQALCFVVARKHPHYAGHLTASEAAAQVRGAIGESGRNEDYVLNTVEHLKALGIRDLWLEAVAAQVNAPPS